MHHLFNTFLHAPSSQHFPPCTIFSTVFSMHHLLNRFLHAPSSQPFPPCTIFQILCTYSTLNVKKQSLSSANPWSQFSPPKHCSRQYPVSQNWPIFSFYLYGTLWEDFERWSVRGVNPPPPLALLCRGAALPIKTNLLQLISGLSYSPFRHAFLSNINFNRSLVVMQLMQGWSQ